MNEDEDLVLLLTDTCDLCGRKFADGEEFYLLKRVLRGSEGGGEVVTESAICLDCPLGLGDGLPACATGKEGRKGQARKLPAWLKNATAAVRRDYLKGQARHE